MLQASSFLSEEGVFSCQNAVSWPEIESFPAREANEHKGKEMKKQPNHAHNTEKQIRLGLRIKDLREERGLSQYACAPRLGMSRTYLADLECGRRNISLARLAAMAEGFDITLEELFKGV